MKYWLETYGCAANRFDSLLIEEAMERDGWEASGPESADVIILNTCGVKRPTEDKIVQRLEGLVKEGRRVVVAGCLPRIAERRLKDVGYSASIDTRSVERAAEAARAALSGSWLLDIREDEVPDKPSMLRRRLSETTGVIEIEEGCNYSCSFCATKFSRGTTVSFPPGSIVRAASELVRQGAVEIWLTGQDVAAYRHGDIKLPGLVEMVKSVDGWFNLRLGMSTPPLFRTIMGELLRGADEKVYHFFHVPVQSGSDRVLRDMKRGHPASLFEEIVSGIRAFSPLALIETDVIVGYPTEEEGDFEMTVKLLERTMPDTVNVSKFWPREGTPASAMKQLDTRVVARRSREMREVVMDIMKRRNELWIGWEGPVVVTEPGERPGTWKGRNFAYKQVVLKSDEMMLGGLFHAKVVEADPVNLFAEPIYAYEDRPPLLGSSKGPAQQL